MIIFIQKWRICTLKWYSRVILECVHFKAIDKSVKVKNMDPIGVIKAQTRVEKLK